MKILLLLAMLSAGACASVQSVTMTNLRAPLAEGRPIEARVEKTVVLGLNFDNDYVFQARKDLLAQCPNGVVTGVMSTYETYWYVVLTDHVVKAEAVCVEGGAHK